jgi:hypothetical protein
LVYTAPRLIDLNAKSRLLRGCRKILIVGRCVEVEHPDVYKRFVESGYCPLSVCLEAEHVNMVGFKLAGMLRRGVYEEVSVLTVDGSMHCTQLHWMVEEVFKVVNPENVKRRHFVIHEGELLEVSHEAVKASRFLSRVEKLLKKGSP